jgi:hypothetical protein
VYRKEIWQHARQQTTDAKRKENRHEKHPLHPK